MDSQKPEQQFSRDELRYRIADAINDRLKSIPLLHATAKGAAHWLQHRRDVRAIKKTQRAIREEFSPAAQPTNAPTVGELPVPPLEMRRLVGPTDLALYNNPNGELIYPYLPPESFRAFFDFGCGCGRVARQLMLQRPSPELYVGVDLHPAMIQWCNQNLHPVAPNFHFHHHDVFNVAFNPGPHKPLTAPFPVDDSQFTLVNAISVFTHLTEAQAAYYLRECARVLRPDGVLHASWFLFDKADHPMMDDSSNALYVSYTDPSAAAMFDRKWVRDTARSFGLRIFQVIAPSIRGYQWLVLMTPRKDVSEIELPEDKAPRGIVPPRD
jgi:SAM-dependent methyltransferase